MIYTDFNGVDTVLIDEYAINNSVKNILLTRKGSMPGKPRFGSQLYKILFGHLDHITVNVIQNYIREAINEFEPRIDIKTIEVKEVPEYNRIVVDIIYTYKNLGRTNTSSVSINL
jgi:phage baseplate assembly protein W